MARGLLGGTCNAIICIAGDMAVHHIQQHQQPQPVRFIYQCLRPHRTHMPSISVVVADVPPMGTSAVPRTLY